MSSGAPTPTFRQLVAGPLRPFLIGVGVLLPFLVLVGVHWNLPPLLTSNDYAHYLMHADALVKGRPYGETGYIFTSLRPLVGPVVLPPGLPLALYPILAVAGPNPILLKLLMVASACAFLLLVLKTLSTWEGWWLAAGVTLFLGVVLETNYATNVVKTDLGFCAFVWAVVLLAGEKERWGWGRTTLIMLLGSGAILYRLAGAPLIPAMLLFGLVGFKAQRSRPFLIVAVWIAALLLTNWVVKAPGRIGGVSLEPVISARLGVGPAMWAKVAFKQVVGYRLALFDSHLYPFSATSWNQGYHVLTFVLMLVGLVGFLSRHRRSFLIALLIFYVPMLLVVQARDSRYLWPLYPLTILGLFRGVAFVSQRLRPATDSLRLAGLAAVGLGLWGTIGNLGAPRPETFLDRPAVRELFQWVRSSSATSSWRACFFNPRVLAWETGVPAMVSLPGKPDGIRAELRRERINLVIVGDLGAEPRAEKAMRATIELFPSLFRPVFQNQRFTAYQFAADDSTSVGKGPS